jgi:hypothetical protein
MIHQFNLPIPSVLLRDIQVLTLQNGQMTTGRRSGKLCLPFSASEVSWKPQLFEFVVLAAPVSQLSCVGGSAQCRESPQSVLCHNMGTDGVDVQWKVCRMNLMTLEKQKRTCF